MASPDVKRPKQVSDADLVEIIEQISCRLRAGEAVDVKEYAAGDSERLEQLKQMLPTLQALADLGHSMEDGPVAEPGQEKSQKTTGGTLGDYRIIREIGRGGMGVVYEAEQISLHRKVALKVLPFAAVLDPKQLQRFKNEAHAVAQLHHQNIVPVYSVGCERAVHFYAMQYIEGQTLAKVIGDLQRIERVNAAGSADEVKSAPELTESLASDQFAPPIACSGADAPAAPSVRETTPAVADETGRLPGAPISSGRSSRSPGYFRSIAELGIQVAEALDHAHQHGVIHRDMKPANVILDVEGKAWVTDFGLARITTDATLTLSGDLLGTLRYMSPEQALAKRVVVDHRTDVYSLGVTLYELLTLQPAFTGQERQELLRQIAFEEPKTPRRVKKSVPAELETIVLKAMAKNPAERYDTALEIADDLERFLEDKPIRAKRPNLVQRAAKLVRRHRAVAASIGVTSMILLVAVAVGAMLIADQALMVAEKEREKQKAAVAARDRERDLREEAERQQRRAEAYLEIVGDAVDKMLSRVTEESFIGSPKTEPVRRRMLEDALALYRRLADVSRADRREAFEAGEALHRLVNKAQFVLGDLRKLAGQDEEAAELWREALDDFPSPYVDYRLRITTPGIYRFYPRWGGINLSSDSFFARIVELADGPQGEIADWYCFHFLPGGDSNFATDPWQQWAAGAETVREAVGPTLWPIPAPGDYTLRLMMRDNGTTVDAFVLQLATLPAPTGEGPPESATTDEKVFVEVDGQVVVEAEHFSARGPEVLGVAWRVVPDETAGQGVSSNFRGGGYLQVLPDGGPFERIAPERAGLPDEKRLAWDLQRADKVVEILASEPDAWSWRATLYRRQGKPDKAMADFDRYLALDPTNAGQLNHHAWSFALSADVPPDHARRAVAMGRRAVELVPNASSYWNTLGTACYRARQWNDAIESLRHANDVGRGSNFHYNALVQAMAHWQLGEKERARKLFDAAVLWIEKHGDSPDLQRFRTEAAGLLGPSDAPAAQKPDKLDDMRLCTRILEADPEAGWAYAERAAVYAGRNKWEKAVADFSKAVEISPDSFGAHYHWYRLALAHLAAEDIGGYRTACGEMTNQLGDTEDPEAADFIAWTCALAPGALDDLSAPVTLAEKAVQSDPQSSSHLKALGAVLFRAGRFSEAVERLTEADRLGQQTEAGRSSPAYAWYFLAMAHYRLGQTAEAEKWLDKAIVWSDRVLVEGQESLRHVPLTWNRRLTLQLLYRELESLDETEQTMAARYTRLIEQHPNDPWRWLRRARFYSNRGKPEESSADFAKALALNPQGVGILRDMGIFCERTGDLDGAIALYSKAIELHPDTWDLHVRRGEVYEKLKRWDEAAADFCRALDLRPTVWRRWRTRADEYEEAKRSDAALALYSTVIEVEPEEAVPLQRRGLHHAIRAHWQEAAADYERAVRLDATRDFNWFFLAHLRLQIGDIEGYRLACGEMLGRFGRSEDPVVARRTARVCLLAPGAVGNYELLLELADHAVSEGSEFPRACQLVRGMADYRTGQFDGAIEWFHKSLGGIPTEDEPVKGSWDHRATAYLFLAMAHHRLGHAEEAQKLLAEAQEIITVKAPKIESGYIGPNWCDWLGAHFALREAEALIGKDE